MDEGVPAILARLTAQKAIRTRIIEFNHRYTVKLKNDKYVVNALAVPSDDVDGGGLDPTTRTTIYDFLHPSDEAIALMYYMNMQALWGQRAEKDDEPDDPIHSKNRGIWTQRGQGKYKPGFKAEGMSYYYKALELFGSIRDDDDLAMLLRVESAQWYDAHWDGRREIRGKKRKVDDVSQEGQGNPDEQEAASMEAFIDWEDSDDEEEVAAAGPPPALPPAHLQNPHDFQAASSPSQCPV